MGTAFYDGFFKGCLIVAVIVGFALRGYHVTYHPEWTEMQFFWKFLPIWGILGVIAFFALLWSAMGRDDDRPRPSI